MPDIPNYFDPHMSEDGLRQVSSIALAHVGDAVYELLVRSWLCEHGKITGKAIHRAAVELVNAPAQARLTDLILPLLSDEELSIFRRGRNAHVNTIPHSAAKGDYLKATALECLFGYLYLSGQRDRINLLFHTMMKEDLPYAP